MKGFEYQVTRGWLTCEEYTIVLSEFFRERHEARFSRHFLLNQILTTLDQHFVAGHVHQEQNCNFC
jgi:hypothetical protein